MNDDRKRGISRRDFGRGAVMVLAGSTIKAAPGSFAAAQNQGAGLSATAQAEVESKMQNIIARWGDRLTDDQKTRMRGIVTRHVRMLETVRAFPVANGDCPASVLKLMEGRSVPAGAAATKGSASADPAKR